MFKTLSATPTPVTEARQKFDALLHENQILLFIKGTSEAPQCGFSANTIKVFQHFNADYATYNILEDPTLREKIKEFSQWPTFPQVYIRGELVGGNDIIMDMVESGELEALLQN